MTRSCFNLNENFLMLFQKLNMTFENYNKESLNKSQYNHMIEVNFYLVKKVRKPFPAETAATAAVAKLLYVL